MEFEVRHVGGIRNCFVSLPFSLIQTIQSTCPPNASLPNPLVLELRSSSPTSSLLPWSVSWSGATSSSPNSVEIAAQFADCISLPDRTNVRVRVISFVPIAERVVIEPVSEDDWEVVEHKSGLAENTMLQQVRIIGANMRFPLWLHGDTVTTYMVMETVPEYDIVQLVPGCEVAVAPKQRLKAKKFDTSLGVNALLRIQDCDEKLVVKDEIKGVDLSIALTTVAYLHPQTAEKFSLTAFQQVVIVPKVSLKALPKVDEKDSSKTKVEESNPRHSLVCLLLSDSVGKGHIMISLYLRLYLRAPLHSWVYIMRNDIDPVENVSLLYISRCIMKLKETEKSTNSKSIDEMVHSLSSETVSSFGSFSSQIESLPTMGEDAAASLFERSNLVNGDEFPSIDTGRRLKKLVVLWFRAQSRAIQSRPSAGVYSLVLPKETVLHFRINRQHNEFLEENIWSFFGSAQELTLLLAINEKAVHEDEIFCYDIDFDENKNDFLIPGGFLSSWSMGNPINLDFQHNEAAISHFPGDVSSLSWIGEATFDVINRLKLLLSPELGLQLFSYNLPLAGNILIYGPHGSGKTILAQGVAKSLENCKDILAHIVFIKCSLLSIENKSHIRQLISGYISEAIDHAPSLVIFDDLDSILSSPNSLDGSPPMTEDGALANFFVNIIDEFAEIREKSCGFGPIAIMATAQTLESIPQQLTTSGRLDFHVQLPVPATSERSAILKHEIKKRSLECSDDVLLDVASKCDGYDAHDLEMLIDRTVHAAIGRFLPSRSHVEGHELTAGDFSRAMNGFVPVSMRDVTKPSNELGRSGWDDVGGLTEITKSIKEMIELPSKYPEIFAQSPLRMRSNVLLYGPPGCGKTHIVGAAAAACSLRFISVKGPELLNKYIGASEQAVRDIFSKAAAAAPCLLFFDEFDSIAPKRGHDNTGVTDRVVNQFLTELDGVEVLAGVFVFAATSRPDLLDAALLRPGRLDRLLFCDFPSRHERLDILRVLSRKLPLAGDVKMDKIADMTEGFSGADLQALLSDAQLEAVHEHLNSADGSDSDALPLISSPLLFSVASKARPSISHSERKRLNAIYDQFLDSKKSLASLTRDAKGKKATLA